MFKRQATFKPAKKRENTLRYKDLYKYAAASLGTNEDIRTAVEKPPATGDPKEWLGICADNFTNEVMILYQEARIMSTDGRCEESTTVETIVHETGEHVSKQMKPTSVSAPTYCGNCIDWVLDLLDDEKFFPQEQGNPFPKDFEKKIKKIFQRLIRIYAHFYRAHLEEFESQGSLAHLNSCFRHLYYFCTTNNMIKAEDKDWEPVREEIKVIVKADQDPG